MFSLKDFKNPQIRRPLSFLRFNHMSPVVVLNLVELIGKSFENLHYEKMVRHGGVPKYFCYLPTPTSKYDIIKPTLTSEHFAWKWGPSLSSQICCEFHRSAGLSQQAQQLFPIFTVTDVVLWVTKCERTELMPISWIVSQKCRLTQYSHLLVTINLRLVACSFHSIAQTQKTLPCIAYCDFVYLLRCWIWSIYNVD